MCRNVAAFLTIYNGAYAAPAPFNRTTANNNEAWAAPVDFGILDAEGWTIESFYVASPVYGTPRRAAPVLASAEDPNLFEQGMRAFTGKEDYKFGDLTKNATATAVARATWWPTEM